jgi:hypothetical protein
MNRGWLVCKDGTEAGEAGATLRLIPMSKDLR